MGSNAYRSLIRVLFVCFGCVVFDILYVCGMNAWVVVYSCFAVIVIVVLSDDFDYEFDSQIVFMLQSKCIYLLKYILTSLNIFYLIHVVIIFYVIKYNLTGQDQTKCIIVN